MPRCTPLSLLRKRTKLLPPALDTVTGPRAGSPFAPISSHPPFQAALPSLPFHETAKNSSRTVSVAPTLSTPSAWSAVTRKPSTAASFVRWLSVNSAPTALMIDSLCVILPPTFCTAATTSDTHLPCTSTCVVAPCSFVTAAVSGCARVNSPDPPKDGPDAIIRAPDKTAARGLVNRVFITANSKWTICPIGNAAIVPALALLLPNRT